MITLDESTLIAYVDGELDSETNRLVEGKLNENANAKKYVEHLREISALSRIAFNDTLHQSVPQALKDTILNVKVEPNQAADNVVSFAAPRAKNEWRMALPMAAAVAFLFLGLGGGYQYSKTSAENALKLAAFTLEKDKIAMEGALNKALEVNMSGNALSWKNPDSKRSVAFTPVRTYQDKTGTYCREYRKDLNAGGKPKTTFGLACREGNGTWKTRYLILNNKTGRSF